MRRWADVDCSSSDQYYHLNAKIGAVPEKNVPCERSSSETRVHNETHTAASQPVLAAHSPSEVARSKTQGSRSHFVNQS